MLLMLFVLLVIPPPYIPAAKLCYLFNALIMKRLNGVKMLQKVSLTNSNTIYVLYISDSLKLSSTTQTLGIEQETKKIF